MTTATPLRLTKDPKVLIEPIKTGHHGAWEGHHATNPTCFRIPGDPRVFLGYRAGGSADYFKMEQWDVWGSHLGLAILDEHGTRVLQRFPLPIMEIVREFDLPRNAEEYKAYLAGPWADVTSTLYDFRAWVDGDWVHIICHEGTLNKVWDCISRMPCADFLARIAKSQELAGKQLDGIRDQWAALWWAPGVWQPCGVNGTNRIYASQASKNDIVFLRLDDGSLRMHHRPCPDNAVLATGQNTFSTATADGITAFGTLQTCIRPGFTDNSHIGVNGAPIRVRLGDAEVFMDIVHGVYNEMLGLADPPKGWKLTYYPYLRLCDTVTGDVLYYSKDPVLDVDDVWREYVVDGEWVANLDHLDAVMFAGGQTEQTAGRNGLDDVFNCYTGIGDTAVARAEFRLRDVVPPEVVRDIRRLPARRGVAAADAEPNWFAFPGQLCGWFWQLGNDPASRSLVIRRSLEREGLNETADRTITPVPGGFDADGVSFGGSSARLVDNLGWIAVFRGVRWEENDGQRVTEVGHGVLVLDAENPERVLFRSTTSVAAIATEPGWTSGRRSDQSAALLASAVDFVPAQVRVEIANGYKNKPMPSHMTRWLKTKAGFPVE